MAKVKKINSDEFTTTVLQASHPVLVDFYADWCPPCRALAPSLERLAADLDGKASIVKINVDENPNLTQQFNIRGIPTLLTFEAGELVDTTVGAPPVEALRARLDRSAGTDA